MSNKTPWLTVVGIGEDGLDGLGATARDVIAHAEVLVGGARHHVHVPDAALNQPALRLDWQGGMETALEQLAAHKGQRIVVLASGDPLYYGVGATLARRFGEDSIDVIPAPGAVSLAAARLGWSIPDVAVVTVHGRPVESLVAFFQPGQRILALAEDGNSAAQVARLLVEHGFGQSRLRVFEHLGGLAENRLDGTAATWPHGRTADLNVLAIDCVAQHGARAYSRLAGLPDDAFAHDGQLTKREVRAATLARLAPKEGETLWDVGAGAGSIAIEWLRAGRDLRAVAFERVAIRAERIRTNARRLGVPRLEVIEDAAPDGFTAVSVQPDAVFVGGSAGDAALLAAAFSALRPGGRLVANAVLDRSADALQAFADNHDGTVSRIAIEHRVNGTWVAKRPITQLVVEKPA